jgi:hypothetical protein
MPIFMLSAVTARGHRIRLACTSQQPGAELLNQLDIGNWNAEQLVAIVDLHEILSGNLM